jgi:hypothetical protein
MKRIIFLLAVIALVACVAAPASAALFIGGVSVNPQQGGDGLMVVGGDWTSGSLDWEVSDNPNGSWHYKYTFNIEPSPETSHFILELSLGVSATEIMNLTAEDSFGSIEVNTFGPAPSNPGIPGSIFGVKIDETTGNPLIINFDIFRDPVWGDFYAKGGSTSFAYNAGFLAVDPLVPPTNGSILDHILRPDSTGGGGVPELSSLAAWGVCLAGAGLVAYRRNRRRGMTA